MKEQLFYMKQLTDTNVATEMKFIKHINDVCESLKKRSQILSEIEEISLKQTQQKKTKKQHNLSKEEPEEIEYSLLKGT